LRVVVEQKIYFEEFFAGKIIFDLVLQVEVAQIFLNVLKKNSVLTLESADLDFSDEGLRVLHDRLSLIKNVQDKVGKIRENICVRVHAENLLNVFAR
jgi:hypothetical protein